MPPSRFHCQCCDSEKLQEIPGFSILPRVTSDCKPFPAGGALFTCGNCGAIQKIPDDTWLEETRAIYRDYAIFHQSRAIDQAVFDPASGESRQRCGILAQRIKQSGLLPAEGMLLDVGAGSGAMLAACSASWEHWKLFGLDLDDRKEGMLKAIPRFERLYTTAPDRIAAKFDLLTLIHSLEHFPEPGSMLRSLRANLAENGRLFVEVPNAEESPFDLVVADHLCHFTADSLSRLVSHCGFGIDSVATDWVKKEISLIAASKTGTHAGPDRPLHAITGAEKTVAWLTLFLEHARHIAAKGRFGIFGTSISATWLASGLGEAVEFFVDEDAARAGGTHLGRVILRPEDVPAGSTVYLAFAPETSKAIGQRVSGHPATFIMPPPAP
jgi:SAM-dependent methyltransferase